MGFLPLATQPQPPNNPIAQACSSGSENTLTRSVKAEGIVIEEAEMWSSSAKTITPAGMLTYSTQCSENDDRNSVINESSAQRDDTKTRYPLMNAISLSPLISLYNKGSIVLTQVVYVADAAALNKVLKCKVRINKTSMYDKQKRCKGQLECTDDPSGLTFSHTHGYLKCRDCREESRVIEGI